LDSDLIAIGIVMGYKNFDNNWTARFDEDWN